jgi:hypothetical protein
MDRLTSKPALVAEALALIAAPACACDAQGVVWRRTPRWSIWLAQRRGTSAGGAVLQRSAGQRRRMNPGWRWPASGAGTAFRARRLAVEVRAGRCRRGRHGRRHLRVRRAADTQAAGRPVRGRVAAALEHATMLEHAPVGIVVTLPRPGQVLQSAHGPHAGLRAGRSDQPSPAEVFLSRAEYESPSGEAIAVLTSGELFEKAEMQLRRRDGTPIWCRIRAKAHRPESREAGTVWILEDVSEARQALTESRRS